MTELEKEQFDDEIIEKDQVDEEKDQDETLEDEQLDIVTIETEEDYEAIEDKREEEMESRFKSLLAMLDDRQYSELVAAMFTLVLVIPSVA
jgi:hypothetical protein